MLPDRVSNPGPLTYESDALPIALRGPADIAKYYMICYKGVTAYRPMQIRKCVMELWQIGKISTRI